DALTGDLIKKLTENEPPKFQDVFGLTLVELAEKNEKIIGITPDMPSGSSLKFMMDAFTERAFDVGIAEQHAVTLAAGMATQGMVVFCNVYSTFLQRAYDQVIHDVALQNLPVIFCLDRAGLGGEDGATHHGVFDLAYLRCLPNMIIFAPRNEIELRNILFTSQKGLKNPIAIRYPRGKGQLTTWVQPFETIEIGKGIQLKNGDKIAILSVGTMAYNVTSAIEICENPDAVSHYDMRFVKPLDVEMLQEIFTKYKYIITIEDGVKSGGFGSAVLEFAAKLTCQVPIKVLGIEDQFVEHGTLHELQQLTG